MSQPDQLDSLCTAGFVTAPAGTFPWSSCQTSNDPDGIRCKNSYTYPNFGYAMYGGNPPLNNKTDNTPFKILNTPYCNDDKCEYPQPRVNPNDNWSDVYLGVITRDCNCNSTTYPPLSTNPDPLIQTNLEWLGNCPTKINIKNKDYFACPYIDYGKDGDATSFVPPYIYKSGCQKPYFLNCANDDQSWYGGQGCSLCGGTDRPCTYPGSGDCTCSAVGGSATPKAHHFWARDWNNEIYYPYERGYTGPMVRCCSLSPNNELNDWVTDPNTDKVITTRTQVCPADLWAMSSKCTDPMYENCTTLPTYKPKQEPYCTNYVNQIYGFQTNAASVIPKIADTKVMIADSMSNWLSTNKYSNGSGKFVLREDDQYLPIALNFCTIGSAGNPNENLGVCDNYLNDICAGVKATDLVDKNGNQTKIAKLCGCYLPPSLYQLPSILPLPCTGACSSNYSLTYNSNGTTNYNGVILSEASGNGGNIPLYCKQSTCVLDDIAINLLNSSANDITFTQGCNGCSGGHCTCIISDINNTLINSSAGDIIINNCTTCSTNGDNTTEACSSYMQKQQLVSHTKKENFEFINKHCCNNNYIIVILIIVLLAIAIFIYFTSL